MLAGIELVQRLQPTSVDRPEVVTVADAVCNAFRKSDREGRARHDRLLQQIPRMVEFATMDRKRREPDERVVGHPAQSAAKSLVPEANYEVRGLIRSVEIDQCQRFDNWP